MITSFSGPNRFLSNFFEHPMMVDGLRYPTLEHAYQAAKTNDPELRERIRSAATPGEAKRAGKLVPLRSDWDERRLEAVRCSAWFGAACSGLSDRFDTIDWEFPCVQLFCKRWK